MADKTHFMNERGVALLIVLVIVAVLGSLVFDFSYLIRVDLTSAGNFRSGTKAYLYARSGIEACRALLRENRNGYDSLTEYWATERPPVALGDGIVQVRIEDANSKVNINKISSQASIEAEFYKNELRRLCVLLDIDEQVAENIIDWIDADDEGSAEEAFYQSLKPPYHCKNGPLDSLQELLLVEGVTDQMFYGSKEKPGLKELVCIRGNGLININTAGPLVLQTLDDRFTEDIAYSVIAARERKVFKNIGELKERNDETGVDKKLHLAIQRYIAVSSDAFTAYSTAKVQDFAVRVKADLDKEGRKILFWKRY